MAKARAKSAAANGTLSLFPEGVPSSSPKPCQGEAVVAVPLHPRVTVSRAKKQRTTGLQKITTAAETTSCSAFAVWTELKKHAYQETEITKAGLQVEYLLSSVGRTELRRLTRRNRKTVRLAIRDLKKRHLITLHAPADPYMDRAEIYRLNDPDTATEMMLEDGLSAWRQRGRGRVLI
jgi:hypothetical protein